MTKRAREWKQVTQKIDIESVMQEFVLAKRAEHTSKTARWYEQTCKYFLQFLKDNNHSTRLADVEISQAPAFVVALQSRPKHGGTKFYSRTFVSTLLRPTGPCHTIGGGEPRRSPE